MWWRKKNMIILTLPSGLINLVRIFGPVYHEDKDKAIRSSVLCSDWFVSVKI